MKKKKIFIIIAVVIGLLAIAGGVYCLLNGNKKSNKELFTEAIKTKTKGLEKMLTGGGLELKDKAYNLKFNMSAKEESIDMDMYAKGNDFYFVMKSKDEKMEMVSKDGKLYLRDKNEGDTFYYTEMNLELSDENVDNIFKDVKEEDIKKEDTEITINGNTYKVTKLSYELTEDQLKDINDKNVLGDEKENKPKELDKILVEAYLYKEEIIKMTIASGTGQTKTSFNLVDVKEKGKGYYDASLTTGGMKVLSLKANEVKEGEYDLSLVISGLLFLEGKAVKTDKEFKLNVKNSDGSLSLDMLISKKSEKEFDASLEAKFMEEKVKATGTLKEIEEMPKVDLSNSKPLEQKPEAPAVNEKENSLV